MSETCTINITITSPAPSQSFVVKTGVLICTKLFSSIKSCIAFWALCLKRIVAAKTLLRERKCKYSLRYSGGCLCLGEKGYPSVK